MTGLMAPAEHPRVSPAARRVARVFSAALTGAWVAFLVAVILGGVLEFSVSALNDWMLVALCLGAAGSTLARVALVPVQRWVWAPLGAGMLSYGLGAVAWTFWIQRMASPPFPSLADPLWLALYPLSYVTIALAVRRQVGRLSASVWLDGLIATLSVAALGTALLLGPVAAAAATGSFSAVATNLAYPVGDVVLAASVVGGCVLSGWRLNRGWALLAAGFVAFTAADVIYLKSTVEAAYVTVSLQNLLWSGGTVLLAWAVWAPPAEPGRGRDRLGTAVPAAFAFAAVALLVSDHWRPVDAFSLALAAATVVAAMIRLLLTAREERSLRESRRQAHTDELTGLPNRRALADLLATALGADVPAPLSLLVIDLNGFKELNDALGHEAGDEVLRHVGRRLGGALREDDLLVRLGGDEFAVVLHGCAGSDAAERVATKLLGSLEASVPVMGIEVQIGASIGVACHPEHGRTAGELLKRGDVAMYRAKSARTGVERYDGANDGSSTERLALVGELGNAIAAGEIVPYYQPQVNPATGVLVGVEALARWEHPRLGVLTPGRFLPALEQSNLSRLLTLSILEHALRDCASWRAAGVDVSVSVNLSAANLVDDGFDADVAGALERHGLPANRLRLEITENIFLTDPERALRLLHRLRAQGIKLSLDDFGTKHSSLSHLDMLPVDELKIDRSFIAELTAKERTAIIVASTIQLAAQLGLDAVAEGIEDEETRAALAALGCPAIQGHLVARPMPAADLLGWATGRPAAAGLPK
jgi:diguanylate cyclase